MDESTWRLPGYVIEEPIGAGADGRVWRARVRRSGDPVAVKLLPVHERGQLDAARAEAALLTGLDHPHLVRLHEAVPCRRGLALVLDLAAGGSLAQLLAARGRLTQGEVVTTIAPVGAALAYAHNAGVVHGDVSAANVLFTGVGLPLLADLGVARLTGDDTIPARSTPAYVDPAVAAGGVPSPASDVFMLAAVALHALTGEPAWPLASADAAYAAAARGDLGDVAGRLHDAGVSDAVAQVITRGLQIDPARRPTAAEFALDLRHAAEPAAVELSAGRARHRAAEPGPDPTVLTYGHRLPPPARTPARTLRALRPELSARVMRLGLVTALLAALLTGLLWWAHDRGGRPAAAAGQRSATATGAGSHSVDAVGATAQPPAPDVAQLDAAAASKVLTRLDVARARAYAQRDPALLAQVYVPGTLRTQDAAQLQSIVPAGCGLFGASTVYSHVAVESRAATQAVLRVSATLRASMLECGGKPAGQAPAAGPITLRIALQRVGTGYLIASVNR
ncbi:MAG TPA: serine/threonine-protein kinase [Jatrophihabitantaceae bacterium]|nr:serine/threonine-protein kinase [Jatrophihabitantaceae bacterium]